LRQPIESGETGPVCARTVNAGDRRRVGSGDADCDEGLIDLDEPAESLGVELLRPVQARDADLDAADVSVHAGILV